MRITIELPSRPLLLIGLLAVGGMSGWVAAVHAAGIPDDGLIYAGVLEEDGAPAEGSFLMQASLVTAASGGASVCAPPAANVTVNDGRFRLNLSDCRAAIEDSPDLFVALTVNGTALPRAKIGAVPYAVEAAHALEAERAADATGSLQERLEVLEQDFEQEAPFVVQANIVLQVPEDDTPVIAADTDNDDDFEPYASSFQLTASEHSAAVEIACAGSASSTGVVCPGQESLGISFVAPRQGMYQVCVVGGVSIIVRGTESGPTGGSQFVLSRLVETTGADQNVEQGGFTVASVGVFSEIVQTSPVVTGLTTTVSHPVSQCEVFAFSPGEKTVRVQFKNFHENVLTTRPRPDWSFLVTRL